MFFLVSQNISVDVLKSTADAKKLEKRIDERLETAYELLLLYAVFLPYFLHPPDISLSTSSMRSIKRK